MKILIHTQCLPRKEIPFRILTFQKMLKKLTNIQGIDKISLVCIASLAQNLSLSLSVTQNKLHWTKLLDFPVGGASSLKLIRALDYMFMVSTSSWISKLVIFMKTRTAIEDCSFGMIDFNNSLFFWLDNGLVMKMFW